MAWTTPDTWVAGVKRTAANLNAQIRDNLTHLYNLLGGQKIQAGYTNVSVSGVTGTITLTYPVAFAGTAIPIAVVANRADYYATVGSANATSCQLTVTHYQGSSATTTVAVHWLAIGPPA